MGGVFSCEDTLRRVLMVDSVSDLTEHDDKTPRRGTCGGCRDDSGRPLISRGTDRAPRYRTPPHTEDT